MGGVLTGWTVRDTATGALLCPPTLLQWHAETVARVLSQACGQERYVAVYVATVVQ